MRIDAFYVTTCPPGDAEGAGEWTVYSDYGSTAEAEEAEEFNDDSDEEGNIRPLDYFFPRN